MIPTNILLLRNNCTLMAVKEVTGKADEEIISAFLKRGYVPHKGVYPHVYKRVIEDLGFKVEETRTLPDDKKEMFEWRPMMTGLYETEKAVFNGMTVAQFSRKHPKGVFVVCTLNHAFVIRDSIVVDPNTEFRGQQRRRKLREALWIVDAAASSRLPEVTRLKRNADPVVKFAVKGARKKLRPSELEARVFYNQLANRYWRANQDKIGLESFAGVNLSEIVKNTSYTRGDAAWDIRRGRMLVVS